MCAFRAVPPVYSPIPFGSTVRAALGVARSPELRQHLQHQFGAADSVLTSSGTAALTLAMRLAQQRHPGAPIVIPAFACFDIATAVIGSRATVRLYDIDPLTLGPDLDSLRHVTSGGAAAVVVVHLFGLPVDIAAVRATVADSGALLIEDAAQGQGGYLRDTPLGAFGDVTVLSFGRGKGLSGGGGGALLSKHESLEPLHNWLGPARQQRLYHIATCLAQELLTIPALYGIPRRLPFLGLGETHYHSPTSLAQISHFSVRLLRQNIEVAAQEARFRQAIAARYLAIVDESRRGTAVSPFKHGSPGWLRFPLLAPGSGATPVPSLGIVRSYPHPLSTLPVLRESIQQAPRVPGAEELSNRLLTVPTHSRMTERDRRHIEGWLQGRDRS